MDAANDSFKPLTEEDIPYIDGQMDTSVRITVYLLIFVQRILKNISHDPPYPAKFTKKQKVCRTKVV